jgi:hypothetical protein
MGVMNQPVSMLAATGPLHDSQYQENCEVENSVVARTSCPCVMAKMAVLRRTLQSSWQQYAAA